MIEVGQKVEFDPFKTVKGFFFLGNQPETVTGTVVMVNVPHKWFSVEYECNGVKLRDSFKFCEIGTAVKICGH